MLKYIFITLVIGIGFLNAGNVQNIENLKAEKKALELKLEAYALKKKIIEMEMFFEKAELEKQKKIDREKALIRLKNDLQTKRNHSNIAHKG
jgi:hypothetical protein